MEISKIWIELFKVLDDEKIFYWLDWGTLLGAIRDKKIFEWDHDIDISIKYNDLDKILYLLKKHNYIGYQIRLQRDLPYVDNIIQIYPKEESNVDKYFPRNLDIYIYKEFKNDYVMRWLHQPQSRYKFFYKLCISIIRRLNKLYLESSNLFIQTFGITSINLIMLIIMSEKCRYDLIPKKYFKDFIKIKFYNRKFNIPKFYKEYLEYLYGKNWLIPDSDYQWRKGNTKKVLNASIIEKPNNYRSVIKFYKP